MQEIRPEPWASMVAYLLAHRDEDRALVARVRRGITDTTEQYSYADVLPYTEKSYQQTALLRAAALIVTHKYVPQVETRKRLPIGKSMLHLSRGLVREGSFAIDPDRPDVVASRLRTLSSQDLDEAANTFNRLLCLAEKSPIALDYYALTRRLLRWGNGISPESMKVREATLAEYYLAASPGYTRTKSVTHSDTSSITE